MSDNQNNNYDYNVILATALISLLPSQERQIPNHWLEQLNGMVESEEELRLRNQYIWIFLHMLQMGTLLPPFDQMPPNKIQGRIEDVLTEETIMRLSAGLQAEQPRGNDTWLENILIGDVEPRNPRQSPVSPSEFLESQPIPTFGAICYFVAFGESDQTTD